MKEFKIDRSIFARGPVHAVEPSAWSRYAIERSAIDLDNVIENDEDDDSSSGQVAVLTVSGVCYYKTGVKKEWLSYFYALEWAYVMEEIEELVKDPRISSIVIDMDSPGGAVFGTPEAAARMRAAAKKKRIVVYANPGIFSAAYWVASQASEIYVLPSGYVGSIGVLIVHMDWSGFYTDKGIIPTVIKTPDRKAETNNLEPLTEGAKQRLQADAERIYSQFVADVAGGRKVSEDYVRDNFGKGGILSAEGAMRVGAADGIMTLEEVLAAELDRASSASAQHKQQAFHVNAINRLKLEDL